MIRLGEQLLAMLPGGSGVLYPLSLLRAGGLKSVSLVDTHYSDFGSLIVAASLVEYFTGDKQDEMLSLVAGGTWTATTTSGDLGSKLTPPQEATDWVHTTKGLGRHVSNNVIGGNDGIMDIYLNGRAPIKKRLALMGDSFGRTICKFLHLWFREVVFLRTRFFHQEFVQLFRPHYIVSENAERYLSSVALDRERTHFLLMPYHRAEKYDPPSEFTETLAELLSVGQARYVAFLHKEFDGTTSAQVQR